MAGPGLLAYILMNKFSDHLPSSLQAPHHIRARVDAPATRFNGKADGRRRNSRKIGLWVFGGFVKEDE
jgi:transposase